MWWWSASPRSRCAFGVNSIIPDRLTGNRGYGSSLVCNDGPPRYESGCGSDEIGGSRDIEPPVTGELSLN